jgi:hypothetical protein
MHNSGMHILRSLTCARVLARDNLIKRQSDPDKACLLCSEKIINGSLVFLLCYYAFGICKPVYLASLNIAPSIAF